MGYDNVQGEFAVNTSGEQLCAPCLKQYIHQLDLPMGNCELCDNRNVNIIDFHWSNWNRKITIMFLWHWWNGRNYCLTCVDDLLDTGKVRNTY
jgi:hypothetical protein